MQFKKGENMFNIFKKSKIDFIIVGLGNPGLRYEKTRHNTGFMAIDYILKKINLNTSKSKYNGLYEIGNIDKSRVLLLKPQTFMNLSGNCVNKFLNFYKINTEKLIVIYDDISLPIGKLKIRKKGSSGGHNGIKNIIELAGSDKFIRIKIGVGEKPKQYNLSDYILSGFSNAENLLLNDSISRSFEALKLIIHGDLEKAMNKFNS